MLQDLVNSLAPVAVLLMLLAFNDARLARKRHKVDLRRLAETEERCALLSTDLEGKDRAIAHNGMAYFVAGDRILRAPIRDDGLFLLSDAAPADPITCDDIDPGVLLEITLALGR